MNRYVVQGLAADVAAGKTVAVLDGGGREARLLMRDCAEYMDTVGLLARATMANGRERVEAANGGSATHVRDLRGRTPNVVLFLSRPTDKDVEALRWFTTRVEVLEAW